MSDVHMVERSVAKYNGDQNSNISGLQHAVMVEHRIIGPLGGSPNFLE